MPIIMFAGVFITSFSELLIPEFSRYYAKNDFKRAKSITKFLLIFTIILCTFITVILFLFSEKLGIAFYNNLEVGFYIKILSPIFILMFVDNVIDSILKGLNKQVPIMWVNIIDLFSSIILIYVFVPKLGVLGYIISLYFSEIINLVLSSFVLWKNFKYYGRHGGRHYICI
ncbi:MAG: polysaccharide biosynthesis C-terminal domain-containing protein [Clostridia bacterium]|nr:polysaccharide biosynthesis C-terminal domain-containing protein [Clostridia bacterium]